MEKHCDICKRAVKETVHTQERWFNDYFESHKNDKTLVKCVDCIKKEKENTLG